MSTHPPRRSVASAEEQLASLLDGFVRAGVVPGGQAVISSPAGPVFERCFGVLHAGGGEEVGPQHLYDCASLTKPFVTAACALVLRERGDVDFEERELLPELAEGSDHALPSIGELLLHSAGLPAWEPLYALTEGGLAERARWLGSRREPPGRRSVYGCPGYQLLGLALERRAGLSLAELAREVVLGADDELQFPLPVELRLRAAPTELGNAFERQLAGDRAADYRGFREGLIHGETHDHNAFTVGGAAGNAGLFASARALARLASSTLLGNATLLEELGRRHSPEGQGSEPRSWGFQLAATEGSAAGAALSSRSFGHVGFTGTSGFVDPERRAAFVLLTNRIHPTWTDRPFNADRRRFHAAAAALVDAHDR